MSRKKEVGMSQIEINKKEIKEIQKMQLTIDSLKSDNQKLIEINNNKSIELKQFKKLNGEKRDKLRILEHEKKVLTARFNELQNTIINYKQKFIESEKTLKILNNHNDKLINYNISLKSQIELYQNTENTLNKIISNNINSIIELKDENYNLKDYLFNIVITSQQLINYKIFYLHIRSHLLDYENVKCKICNKRYEDIVQETTKKIFNCNHCLNFKDCIPDCYYIYMTLLKDGVGFIEINQKPKIYKDCFIKK